MSKAAIEYKVIMGDVKATNDQQGTIEGYLNAIGNVDQGNDKTLPGAFRKTLSDAYSRKSANSYEFLWPYLWNHDYNTLPPGGIFDADEDRRGLYAKTRLNLDMQLGRDLYASFKMRTVNKQSIGYRTIKSDTVYENGEMVRLLIELAMLEGSAVVFPMNDLADVTSVKSNIDTRLTQVRYYWPGADLDEKHLPGKHDQSTHGRRRTHTPVKGWDGGSLATREKLLAPETDRWKKSLAEQEMGSIRKYTGGSYTTMNDALRHDKWSKYEDNAKLHSQMQAAQTGLLKGKAPFDLTNTRFVSSDMLDALAAHEGKFFHDKGFTSTSIKPGGKPMFGPVKVEVRIFKGAPGGYVESFTLNHHENEFILPPGAKYKVVSVDKANRHVVVEYKGTGKFDKIASPPAKSRAESLDAKATGENFQDDPDDNKGYDPAGKYTWHPGDVIFEDGEGDEEDDQEEEEDNTQEEQSEEEQGKSAFSHSHKTGATFSAANKQTIADHAHALIQAANEHQQAMQANYKSMMGHIKAIKAIGNSLHSMVADDHTHEDSYGDDLAEHAHKSLEPPAAQQALNQPTLSLSVTAEMVDLMLLEKFLKKRNK